MSVVVLPSAESCLSVCRNTALGEPPLLDVSDAGSPCRLLSLSPSLLNIGGFSASSFLNHYYPPFLRNASICRIAPRSAVVNLRLSFIFISVSDTGEEILQLRIRTEDWNLHHRLSADDQKKQIKQRSKQQQINTVFQPYFAKKKFCF